MSTGPTRYWREAVLLLVLVAPLLALLAGNPIAQDARLSNYADKRMFLGVPNFFDVASNLAFLLVGLAGLFTGAARNGAARSWFGAQAKERGGVLEVQSVVEGSPAQQAGIGAGDEIVALDGFRTDLKQRLARAVPGHQVRLTLFRMDELLDVRVQLGPAPRDTVVLTPDPRASDQQTRLRTTWLGSQWPDQPTQ